MTEQRVKSQAELLVEARGMIQEMQAEFERLGQAGLESAVVTGLHDKWALLSTGMYALDNDYKIGQNVLVHPRTGQVVETINYNPFIGEVFVIDNVTDEWAEVNVKGSRKLIEKGSFTGVKSGDSVLLDSHQTVIQAVIEHVKADTKPSSPVYWDQIGGNDNAKQLLRETIEHPYLHPEMYRAYRQRAVSGILLYGPPGCGKTMLGKAVSTSIDSGFILINGPEVLNEYVGVAEANIRSAFTRARAFKSETGRPAVIFVDEAESLLTTRGSRHNYMGQTVVPTFLAEMQGIRENDAIVILSTNRDDVLDPAVIRDGRIDYKVEVKRPTIDEAGNILSIYIKDKPIKKGQCSKNLVEYAADTLYQHPLPFSGALLEGCVAKAVTHALRRDIDSGKLSGLCHDDFKWATNLIINQETRQAA